VLRIRQLLEYVKAEKATASASESETLRATATAL
jgi:hypothetical protein